MLEFKKVRKSDGRIETFAPHQYADGFYRVEIPVPTLDEVAQYAAQGCAVRVKGDISGAVNLSKINGS